jgi:hypothetical protein
MVNHLPRSCIVDVVFEVKDVIVNEVVLLVVTADVRLVIMAVVCFRLPETGKVT